MNPTVGEPPLWGTPIFGAIVLVLGGVSYVKDRDKVDLGIVKMTTEHKGLIPPMAGAIGLIVGSALRFADRGWKRA